MAKTLTKNEAVIAFDDLIRELTGSDEPIEIRDGNETVAILLSPAEYRDLRWNRAWSAIDEWRARNADKDPDRAYEEITEIVEAVRQELHDQQLAHSGDS